MSKKLFNGSLVALITPFTPNGRIDRRRLEDLVDWQIREGTDGIVCCGTTGESCTLNRSERKTITQICVEVSNNRVPVIVGTGTSDTRETVLLSSDALKLGAKGSLVVTPYYNKPTQRGCLEHYREVSKAGLPVIVYCNPGRAVFRFTLDTLRELSEIEGIVGIKDSTGSLEFMRALQKTSNLSFFSGDDDLTFDFLQEGACGAISVISNLMPRSWKRMIELSKAGNPQGKALAQKLMPLCKAIFTEPNPQCIKYLASEVGLCRLKYRLPLIPPTVATQQKLKRILLNLSLPQFRSQLVES